MNQLRVDDSNRPRIDALIEMLRAISEDPDPVRSINHYLGSMRRLYGEQGLISVSLRNVDKGHYRIMRFLHQRESGFEKDRNIVYAGPEAPVWQGGIIGRIIESQTPVVYRDLQIRDDPVVGDQLAPYRTLVGVPVFDGKETLNWVIFLSVDRDAFSALDVETRILQSNLMSGITNIKRANLELRQATEWIHREIDEIAVIQRGLLPVRMPPVPGLDLAASHRSFDRAGGDFYDVFPLGRCPVTPDEHDGLWGVYIADVSGHGAAAAVIVAMMSTLLTSLAERVIEPGRLLGHLNRHITAKAVSGNFVTAFLMAYDPRTRDVTYACAGHNMPLLREPGGAVASLARTDGVPLGISPDSFYTEGAFNLEPGRTLLLYTDGITEARSPMGRLFGEQALKEGLAASDGTAAGALAFVETRLREHEREQRQYDDQAMLALTAVDGAA